LKFTKIGPLEMGKDRVTDTRAYLNNVELGASQNVVFGGRFLRYGVEMEVGYQPYSDHVVDLT